MKLREAYQKQWEDEYRERAKDAVQEYLVGLSIPSIEGTEDEVNEHVCNSMLSILDVLADEVTIFKAKLRTRKISVEIFADQND